jgi:hypothetical protein
MLEIKVDSLDFRFLRIVDNQGEFEEYDLKEELKVNEAILTTEMLQQPSKYIYWSSLLEKIKLYKEQAEMTLELEIAKMDQEARDFITSHQGKPTKDIVEAYIKRQPAYETLSNNVQYFKYIEGRIARIVKAFEQRKDMLQSYGKQVAEDKAYGRGAGSYIEKTPDQED